MADRIVHRHPIILIRHGSTTLNAQGRFQGRMDMPLNEAGVGQATRLGRKLSGMADDLGLHRFSMQTSPLRRCSQTMDIVAAELGRDAGDIQVIADLVEMSFGRWEGMTTLEVKASYREERRARKANRWEFAPEGGDSYADAAGRIMRWTQTIERPVLAATHLGVMRAAAVVLGGRSREHAMRIIPEPMEVWHLEKGNLERL